MNRDTLDISFRFYQNVENKLISSSEFSELSKKCEANFSVAYANMLMDICSSFEALLKDYFSLTNDKSVNICILIERMENDTFLNRVFDESVLTGTDYGEIQPFNRIYKSSNSTNKTFDWWENYNKIKHNKFMNFEFATQETILKGICALYVLNYYILYSISNEGEINVFKNDKNYFKIKNLKTNAIGTNNNVFRIYNGELSG